MQSIRSSLALLLGSLALGSTGPSAAQDRTAPQGARASEPLDIEALARHLDVAGTEQSGQYKVSVAQNDLLVTVDGFEIVPPMGMGSWAAFAPGGTGAVVMGDVVLRENEIGPVQQVLIRNGLTITGLHNHFVREDPDVMYMHIGGAGAEAQLARAVQDIFDTVADLRGGDPSAAAARTVENTLDTARIDEILGHTGTMTRGVYKHTIARPDVSLSSRGARVTAFMGFNTWAAWQGTPDNAAVAGDFTMLESEVAAVIEALVENGIEVVAVHNHMVHEQPRVFFLHYWGTGPAESLARGLRAALDETGGGGTTTARSAFDDPAAGTAVARLEERGAGVRVVDFEAAPPGQPPSGWTVTMTHEGAPPRWAIERDEDAPDGAKVLAQLSDDAMPGRFPLAIYEAFELANGELRVRFKPISGRVDRAGGLVWRYLDENNYYVVRANALENNVVLYKVENGQRSSLSPVGRPGEYGVKHTVPSGEWSMLGVAFSGSQFTVSFDGEPLFEVEDSSFAGPGRVGLWTKADSVTYFDHFGIVTE